MIHDAPVGFVHLCILTRRIQLDRLIWPISLGNAVFHRYKVVPHLFVCEHNKNRVILDVVPLISLPDIQESFVGVLRCEVDRDRFAVAQFLRSRFERLLFGFLKRSRESPSHLFGWVPDDHA
jgi:hypothetical protein